MNYGPKLPSTVEDMTGQQKGLWKVLKYAGRDNHRNHRWLCRCQGCEQKHFVRGRELRSGGSQSCHLCACSRRRIGYEGITGTWWSDFVNHARKKKRKVTITKEHLWNCYLQQGRCCALAGLPIWFPRYGERGKMGTASPDRIDSRKDYLQGNVQLVHKIVNAMKGVLTPEDFVKWCQRVSKHSRKNQRKAA